GARRRSRRARRLMRALRVEAAAPIGTHPLHLVEVPEPEPAPDEVLVRVHACGCCRTDLHVVAGDLDLPKLPVIPGHQVVGVVVERGAACTTLERGERVGVPWLHRTDGTCRYCRRGQENLCAHAQFTGWTVDGGYADSIVVPETFAV